MLKINLKLLNTRFTCDDFRPVLVARVISWCTIFHMEFKQTPSSSEFHTPSAPLFQISSTVFRFQSFRNPPFSVSANSMELHDEDWELINDDGFVYKRLKRLRLHPTTSAAPPPPDPAAEERNRKERKKKILSKLKTRYQNEIHHWELLSNTLKALQNRTQNQPPPPPSTRSPDLLIDLSAEHPSDSTFRDLIETLLIKVEAQEECISEISNLCDVVEALCNAQEQVLKQPFVCLPIWESSPRKLITSLCEE
ncbi:hypothetical protein L6452_44627 [Arctium lappa]|uniref:Uncharacterized protein n=1 Tax=Arctium lappa TaxID=4217 RepID=A0ACB8XGM2_ARCLA|nr:hypothetical protein L6452_44627 [Arctium lappa]